MQRVTTTYNLPICSFVGWIYSILIIVIPVNVHFTEWQVEVKHGKTVKQQTNKQTFKQLDTCHYFLSKSIMCTLYFSIRPCT